LGGYYRPDRKDITICTNNISKDILGDVIYHELIHANQHCYGKNWGPGCAKKFMIEIEAYYCMGFCGKAVNFKTPKERALDCMFKAIGSICNSSPDKCPNIDVITPEFVADLVKWFTETENNGMCKFFSKYHDPKNGVVELPYTEDWQSTIRCSLG
jgi:hypothetical protein